MITRPRALPQRGFTLIEIAITLVVVTILFGYSVAMFPMWQELKQYRQAERDMDDIVESLIGFAQINGRLPCPDSNADVNGTGVDGVIDGLEDTDDEDDNIDTSLVAGKNPDGLVDGCKAYYGFLPAGTLGLDGSIDASGRLLDPWGRPYRYQVSDEDQNSDSDNATFFGVDLVTPDGVRQEGLANVVPLLFVCDDSTNNDAKDKDCAEVSANIVVANVAAVIVSTGRDRGLVASDIQDENTDDFMDGTDDYVYTFSTRSDVGGAEYDDVIRWISTNTLFTRMIQVDRLP